MDALILYYLSFLLFILVFPLVAWGLLVFKFVFHLLFSYTLTFSMDNIPITVIKNPTKI